MTNAICQRLYHCIDKTRTTHLFPVLFFARLAAILLSLVSSLVVCGDARGGFLVSYSNLFIQEGTVASANVEISSDASPGAPDNLDLFSLHLVLEPLAATGSLSFMPQQSESHLAPGSLNDDYVFQGDSLGELIHASNDNISTVSTTNLTNDTLDVIDGTQSFQGVFISMNNGTSLLFQVNLDARSARAGDTYTIRLIDDARTSISDKDSNLYATGNPGPGLVLYGASFNSSTLKVVATPEPSSSLLLLLCGSAYCAFARRRKAAQQVQQ